MPGSRRGIRLGGARAPGVLTVDPERRRRLRRACQAARVRERRATDPEYAERSRRLQRERYARRRAELREYQREWYRAHAAEINARKRARRRKARGSP